MLLKTAKVRQIVAVEEAPLLLPEGVLDVLLEPARLGLRREGGESLPCCGREATGRGKARFEAT